MDSLYIVMPAYNEEANIEKVVRDWYPLLEGKAEESRLVVACSGCTDRTCDILEELMEELPKLEMFTDCEKQHGPKVIALYDLAIKRGIDYVFQTDSDGQTNPKEFQQFWNMRKEYDGIFGNRTVRGDGKDRAFVEKVVCLLLWLYFGVKIPDANAPFRLMNTKVLEKYLHRMDSEYNIPNIMLTTWFVFYKERHFFKVISFKPRMGGENSISIPNIVRIGWDALGNFMRFKKEMRG